MSRGLSNDAMAARLEALADLLERQEANPFRVEAYRRGARRLRSLPRPASEILSSEGRAGLIELEDIGEGLAGAIDEMVRSGRFGLLERLQGEAEPEALLMTVPGIGAELAHRLHETLHLDSLEALEQAAYDGRLQRVRGVGPQRIQALRRYLSDRLGSGRHPRPDPTVRRPGVAILLEVDREYREAVAAGRLPRIAPRRFNPRGERWLPIGHFEHAGWHFTALFSNTARAHRAGRTHDWVILYFYDDHHVEGQCTIVTEGRGRLSGLRVVRGREEECAAYYEKADAAWTHTRTIDRERARLAPAAVFCSPRELAAHPDLSTEEKIDLLKRWQYDAAELEVAEEEGMLEPAAWHSKRDGQHLLGEVIAALEELTGNVDVEHSPPTKLGGLS